MITPDEILNDVNQDVQNIKVPIIDDIDSFVKARARKLKDLQIVQYEIDYQMNLLGDKEFKDKYNQLKEYVIKEIIDDYESFGWIVEEKMESGKTVLNFATEKIMKHLEYEQNHRDR